MGKYVKRSLDPMNLIFKETPEAAKAPTPTPMADPDSPEVRAARRRSLVEQQGRSGRSSTLLSGGGTTSNFSSTTLG